MALTVGIIGLPNVGKSTLLNALARTHAEASNYPFCTIDSNKGVVMLPDEKLEALAELLKPEEVIPAHISFVDIAGLVKGASRGEGLGNKFLHHIREADVLAHVLRTFTDPEVSHVDVGIDPVRDMEIVETELFLADIERVEKWIEKEEKCLKGASKKETKNLDFLKRAGEILSNQTRIDPLSCSHHEREILADLNLLTSKPVIFVINSDEEGLVSRDNITREVEARTGIRNTVVVTARIESEIAQLDDVERKEYMEALGISSEATERLIKKCHELLGLIVYYTKAKGKLQSWSVKKGAKAPEAAGLIHTDMEKGFIRAKVMTADDLLDLGSEEEVRKKGLLRTEGHDYVIKEGDVVEYLFDG